MCWGKPFVGKHDVNLAKNEDFFLPEKKLSPILVLFLIPPGNMFSWVVFTPTNSIFSTKVEIALKIDILVKKILIFGQIYLIFAQQALEPKHFGPIFFGRK